MTKQIQDTIIFNGKSFNILALSSDLDFSPAKEFGLDLTMWGTANYRGFWCEYIIENKKFSIHTMTVYTKSGQYPTIHSVNPIPEKRAYDLSKRVNFRIPIPWQYKNLDYSYIFTGKLVIEIQENEIYYSKKLVNIVLELEIDQGVLISVNDISKLWLQFQQHHLPKYSYWWQDPEKSYEQFINFRSIMG